MKPRKENYVTDYQTHTKYLPDGFRLERHEYSNADTWRLLKGDVMLAYVDQVDQRDFKQKWSVTAVENQAPKFRLSVEAMMVQFRAGMQAEKDAREQVIRREYEAKAAEAYAALFGE